MTHEELAEWIAHPVWSPRIKRHGVPTEDALRFVDTYTQAVVSATLHVVAEQVQDERDRVDILKVATQVGSALDDACCPLCEEAVCDTGCPLSPVRAQQEAAWRREKQ